MWHSAIIPTGPGESGYWGNWPRRCLSSEIQRGEQISQHSRGFHFIQRLWAALKMFSFPTKKRKGSGHTMVLWQRANLPLLLLDLAVFLIPSPPFPHLLWNPNSLRSFGLVCFAATVPPSGLESHPKYDALMSLIKLQSKISTVKWSSPRFTLSHM